MEIPADSFTADRLTYATPEILAHALTAVLLGGVPARWYKRHIPPVSEARPEPRTHVRTPDSEIAAEIEDELVLLELLLYDYTSMTMETLLTRSAPGSLRFGSASSLVPKVTVTGDEGPPGTGLALPVVPENPRAEEKARKEDKSDNSRNSVDSRKEERSRNSVDSRKEDKSRNSVESKRKESRDSTRDLNRDLNRDSNRDLNRDSTRDSNRDNRDSTSSLQINPGILEHHTNHHDSLLEPTLSNGTLRSQVSRYTLADQSSLALFATAQPLFTQPLFTRALSRKVRFGDPSTTHSQPAIRAVQPAPTQSFDASQKVKRDKDPGRGHQYASYAKRQVKGASKGVAKQFDVRRYVNRMISTRSNGELLRVERMLVLTKEFHGCYPGFCEKEPVDSRIVECWRQYYVVLAAGQAGVSEVGFYLDHDLKKRVHRARLAVGADDSCLAGWYSVSDKLIALVQQRAHKPSRCFIMLCPSLVLAHRWLFLMRGLLGADLVLGIDMFVPDLGFHLKLEYPPDALKVLVRRPKTVTLTALEHGYRLEMAPLIEEMRRFILAELERRRVHQFDRWLAEVRAPWFCYRHYDRLEWSVNNSEVFFIQNQLAVPGLLELRDMAHTALAVDGVSRPHAVEGFVTRDMGWWRSRSYDYVCLSGGILFFTLWSHALPPSDHNRLLEKSPNPEEFPTVYVRNPYPIDDRGHVTWLRGSFDAQRDTEARREFRRRVALVLRLKAMLELSEVVAVDPEGDTGFRVKVAQGASEVAWAPLAATRDEWVARLRGLAQFWRRVRDHRTSKLLETKNTNIELLHINDYIDSNIADWGEAGEIRRARADPTIYNIDAVAGLYAVLTLGQLFLKLKKHANWHKYCVVLVPGYLVIYKFRARRLNGTVRPTTHHEKVLSVPLNRCYLYLGALTVPDLLDRNTEYHALPGDALLPRLYPKDGWRSLEEEYNRCFTLWLGPKRRIRTDHLADNDVLNPGFATLVRRLGVTGKSLVFMARSRQERELWTRDILAEIDRATLGVKT